VAIYPYLFPVYWKVLYKLCHWWFNPKFQHLSIKDRHWSKFWASFSRLSSLKLISLILVYQLIRLLQVVMVCEHFRTFYFLVHGLFNDMFNDTIPRRIIETVRMW